MKEYLKVKYMRYERYIGAAGLLAGFIFDWITLQRVDQPRENLWMAALLLIAALGILALNYYYCRAPEARAVYRHYSFQFWLIFLIQFALGGILSAFLVLYFRSAVLSAAWPFLLLLIAAFVGNEIFKERYARLSYQVGMLYLAIFSFAIFAVPVLTHKISAGIFLLSGVISLVLIYGFVRLLRLIDRQYVAENKRHLLGFIIGLFVIINVFYFGNLIPPIPLSLKDAGAYHQVLRRDDGNYDVLAEKRPWWHRFLIYERLSLAAGEPVYAYSAVFSPTRLNTTIVHQWQRYDPAEDEWLDSGRVELPIAGGREGGFRTYSYQSVSSPAYWRVNVETERGQLIGRIKFKIAEDDLAPFVNWEVLL
ncbi:MAG: DUF2914 domain-containing protein [Patescibacteria group bacterium]|nr:DUF2914 domain-containing protein [Patescibacteria group bacterium]